MIAAFRRWLRWRRALRAQRALAARINADWRERWMQGEEPVRLHVAPSDKRVLAFNYTLQWRPKIFNEYKCAAIDVFEGDCGVLEVLIDRKLRPGQWRFAT